MREFLSDPFNYFLLLFFRLKWRLESRGERKRQREAQRIKYILHGYKTCIFYDSWKYCHCMLEHNKRTYRLKVLFHLNLDCKRAKCKNYIFDPIKE